MKGIHGFCDLNIPVTCNPGTTLKAVVRAAFQMGYDTVAINTSIDESVLSSSKKSKPYKRKDDTDFRVIPPPPQITLEEKDYAHLVAQGRKPQILTRLTVTISDSSQTHKLNQSENVKKYNILSVLPTTPAAFHHACSVMEVDLISFDHDTRSGLRCTRKLYNLAVQRGVYFEVMYAPAIQDASARKNIIHFAHVCHAIGKSRNIIVTSGATRGTDIRGPYDVTNLGLLFGLSEAGAKDALSTTCRALIMHANGRKTGKCVTHVISIADTSKEEEWKTADLTEDEIPLKKMKVDME